MVTPRTKTGGHGVLRGVGAQWSHLEQRGGGQSVERGWSSIFNLILSLLFALHTIQIYLGPESKY